MLPISLSKVALTSFMCTYSHGEIESITYFLDFNENEMVFFTESEANIKLWLGMGLAFN